MTTDLRCPRCDAHVPAGASWCSLCYADLRPAAVAPAAAAETLVEPLVEPLAAEPPAEPLVTPLAAPAPRGKHARRAAPAAGGAAPATNQDVERTAAALLAQLAAHESGSPLGRWSSLIDSPGKKVGLMVGGAAVAMLVLFIVMTLAGTLL